MTPTAADWNHALKLFDHWVEPDKVSRPSETEALNTFRRMLTDQAFREDFVTFLAVGPCAGLIRREVAQRERQELAGAR